MWGAVWKMSQQQQPHCARDDDLSMLFASSSSSCNKSMSNVVPSAFFHHHGSRTRDASMSSSSSSSFWWLWSVLMVVVAVAALTLLVTILRRRRTRQWLEDCGIPTVYWMPRFVNYQSEAATPLSSSKNSAKLSSSTIRNILPRMKRLQGPYGIYGTVYGICTPVVHVAHPLPARRVLCAATTTTVSSLLHNNNNSSSNSKGGSSSSTAPSHKAPWWWPSRTTPSTTRRSGSRPSASSGASKAPAYDHFKNFCGEGVFTANGDDWREKRTAVMHALFRSSQLARTTKNNKGGDASSSSLLGTGYEVRLLRITDEAVGRLCHQLDAVAAADRTTKTATTPCHSHAKEEEQTVEMVSLLQRTTVGIIYQYLTGVRINDENDDATATTMDSTGSDCSWSEDHPAQSSSSTTSFFLSRYLESVVRIRMIILAQSRSVWYLLPRWCYRWWSPMFTEEERVMEPIRAMARRACRDAQPGSPLGLLQNLPLYQHHNDDHKSPSSSRKRQDEFPSPISQNLLDEAVTLLFAGQDTSAATLSWTLHLLSLYPRVQERVVQEISAGGGGGVGEDPPPWTKKSLFQLSYLDAVIKESMRLYPVAPFVVRRLEESIVLAEQQEESSSSTAPRQPRPDDTTTNHHDSKPVTTLPRGAYVCLWIYGLHRHPDIWDRPDDFWPERWLSTEEDDEVPSQERSRGRKHDQKTAGIEGAYMPFAAGPRNCVGQPLAQVVLKALLVPLLQRYRFDDPRLLTTNGEGTNSKNSCRRPQELQKDMQAGFTVLPQDGLFLQVSRR